MGEPLFPLFLKLRGRRVLLVGGGAVAAGKLDALLAAGAEVVVVAPEIRPEIEVRPEIGVRPQIGAGGVRVERRGFAPGDLDGVWLVVAAAPPDVNREVAAAAEQRRIFVNAVDDPGHASAYTGGVLRKGGVTVVVSTGGEAPALAGLLREGLEELVPDEVGEWRRAALRVKRRQRRLGVPMAQRRPELLRALNRLYSARGEESFPAVATSGARSGLGRVLPLERGGGHDPEFGGPSSGPVPRRTEEARLAGSPPEPSS
jgi:uroporphyrin-III C-methyltransferase/precorrin-2 dehydrogenase/sirohydrochlorin ferrochelatase